MISYIIAENPDDRILKQASQLLKTGRLVCLALDTNWAVIADPFVKEGVDRIYRFRHVDNTKHFTVFCTNFHQASEIAYIDDASFRLIRRVTPGPYTFIFQATKKIIKYLKASKVDHEVGVRFPNSPLLEALLNIHGNVVIGSHVTAEMIPDHPEDQDIWSALIEDNFSHLIDMIIDAGETQFTGPTSIISFSQGEPELIRAGAGDISPFGLTNPV